MKAVLDRWTRVLAVCLCGLVRLQAQTGDAATVTGTVVDVSGKPVPTAAVSVRNESSGAGRRVTSGADGLSRGYRGVIESKAYAVDGDQIARTLRTRFDPG